MSFEFTVLPDERFIEILEAWVDSPWPKTAEDGYALRDHFGWKPDYREPALFTSDVRPRESSSYFTARDGKIKSFKLPVTDIAPEEARVDSHGGCSGDLPALLRHSDEPVRQAQAA